MSISQDEFYQNLGARIREIRSDIRELSQAELADRVELSRPSIVNIEKGRQQLSSYQLVLFAFVLGVTPMELLGEKIEKDDLAQIGQPQDSIVPAQYKDWFSHAR